MNSLSGVLFLDEFDKVPNTPEGQGVSGALLHITDFSQNHTYEDMYLAGMKIDLSHVFFVFSLNDLENVDPILRDRISVIHVDSYSLEDKIKIALEHFIPKIERELHLTGDVLISRVVIREIVARSNPAEPGVRKLEQNVRKMWTRINTLKCLSPVTINLSYVIRPFAIPYRIKKQDVRILIGEQSISSFQTTIQSV